MGEVEKMKFRDLPVGNYFRFCDTVSFLSFRKDSEETVKDVGGTIRGIIERTKDYWVYDLGDGVQGDPNA